MLNQFLYFYNFSIKNKKKSTENISITFTFYAPRHPLIRKFHHAHSIYYTLIKENNIYFPDECGRAVARALYYCCNSISIYLFYVEMCVRASDIIIQSYLNSLNERFASLYPQSALCLQREKLI